MRVCKIWDADYPWAIRVEKVVDTLGAAGHSVDLVRIAVILDMAESYLAMLDDRLELPVVVSDTQPAARIIRETGCGEDLVRCVDSRVLVEAVEAVARHVTSN